MTADAVTPLATGFPFADELAGQTSTGPGLARPESGDSLAAAYARCLGSPDGRRILQHLRALTLERAIGPDSSDAALRMLEGQRALVMMILGQVRRGGGREASPVAEAPSSR